MLVVKSERSQVEVLRESVVSCPCLHRPSVSHVSFAALKSQKKLNKNDDDKVPLVADLHTMSFGRPQSFSDLTSTPPDRGSFPLDHFGERSCNDDVLISSRLISVLCKIGECKDQMVAYLSCLKANKSSSTPCRVEGKSYLDCRMTKCVCPCTVLCSIV